MRFPLADFEQRYLKERGESDIVVDDKTAMMTREAFDKLLEYSSTLPSGAYIGKRWKRKNRDETWLMGEYAPNPDNNQVDVIWRDIIFIEVDSKEKYTEKK